MACVPSRNCERRSGKLDGRLDMWYCGPRGVMGGCVRLDAKVRGGAVILQRISRSNSQIIFLGLSGKMRIRWERRRLSETSSVVREVKVWSM